MYRFYYGALALCYEEKVKGQEALGSNGFVYKLNQSMFYKVCTPVCKYINEQIESADNFVMYMYTLDGAVASIAFDKNLSPKSLGCDKAIFKGFVTADNKILRSMAPKMEIKGDDKEILNQKEIGRLIEKKTEKASCLELKNAD